MRNSSYKEMLRDYEGNLIDYKGQREQLLSQHKYSIILEGEYLEFDNLEKWIENQSGFKKPKSIYYDKIDYNYGYVEFFFLTEKQALEIREVIPRIFTTYPNAYPSPSISRTNGLGEFIEYDSSVIDAIVL